MALIRLKYLVRDVDRYGRVRWYVRKPGEKKIRIEGEPGSRAFIAAYERAMGEPARIGIRPGTLRALCVSYYGSAEFKGLDLRTQGIRRRLLDRVCENAGHHRARDVTMSVIRRKRDELADRPEAANAFVKAMRQVYKHGVDMEMVPSNLAKEVPYIKTGSPGHHSWTVEEVAQFQSAHLIGTKARLALSLLLYTGQRRSDVVAIGPQHIRDGWLTITQVKNRKRSPVTISIPVLPVLAEIIAATECGHLAFLVTEWGKPFTANGFGNRFKKWCVEAGLPDHCTAHGLRKAGAAIAAENGASEHEIMAVFGWATPKQAAHYTKAARQKPMAASGMAKMGAGHDRNRNCPTDSPTQKKRQ
jgi:integrase